MTSEQSLLTLKKIKRLSRTLKAFTEGCPECLRVCIYIYIYIYIYRWYTCWSNFQLSA